MHKRILPVTALLMATLTTAVSGATGDGTVVLDDSTMWRQFQIDGAAHVRKADGTLERGRVDPGTLRYGGGAPTFFSSELPATDWASPAFDDGAWPRFRFPQPTPWFREETRGCRYNDPYAPNALLARACFEVKDPAQVKACTFSLDYWGGVVVYVNGKEAARAHLPGNTTNLEVVAEDYPKEAFLTPEGKLLRVDDTKNQDRLALRTRRLQEVRIPVALLQKGVNVVAIETHAAPIGAPELLGRGYGNDNFEWVGWPPIGLLGARLTIAPASAAGTDGPKPHGLRLWNCSVVDIVTAFDYANAGEPLRPIAIQAGRNTVFSGRLMVGSDQPIKGLKVTVGDLAKGGDTLPASAVRIRCAVWEPGKATVGTPGRFDGLLDAIPTEIPVSKATPGKEMFYNQPVDRSRLSPGAVAPLWFTVRVPRDTKPGTYEGTVSIAAEGLAPVSVPLRVSVSAWTARDPKDFRQQNMLFSGEEGLAWHYKIPLWSDKHYEYMGKSLALASELNSRMAIIPLVVEFHESISNPESFVRWIKQPDGSFKYDFTLFDKHLDMLEKSIGKPRPLWLGWKCWGSANGAASALAPTPVTMIDSTGKVERLPQPAPGTAQNLAFWKPVFDEILKKVQARGWLDEAVFGYSDLEGAPPAAAVDIANKLWPGAEWTMYSHIGPFVFAGTDTNVAMKVRHYAYCNDRRNPGNIPWAGKPSRNNQGRLYRDDSGRTGCNDLPLKSLRWRAEDTLRRGWDGSAFGLDMFPIRVPAAENEQYYSVNRCNGARGLSFGISCILYPSPDGPVATERFEVFREGLELSEALLDMEQIVGEKRLITETPTSGMLTAPEIEKILATRKSNSNLLARVMRYREERARTFVNGYFPAAFMQAAEDAKLLALVGELSDTIVKQACEGERATSTVTDLPAPLTRLAAMAREAEGATALALAATPGGTVSPVGTSRVNKGAVTPISAIPGAGSSFQNWTVLNGSATIMDSQTPQTTVTLTGPATLRANFNRKLACAITTPAPGMVVKAGAKLKIAATASVAGGGAVHKVEFFRDGVKIGEASSAPYACEWAAGAAGVYGLTARATTGDGATGSSAPVDVRVTASGEPEGLVATGGLVTTYTEGGRHWAAHTFTNSGTLTIKGAGDAECLLVAGGGGGGGSWQGGGGGGGGFLLQRMPLSSGTYTITVGAGGNGFGQASGPNGGISKGGDSALGGTTGVLMLAYGGGYGAAQQGPTSGGSGGGGASEKDYPKGAGGDGPPRQGYAGEDGGRSDAGAGGGAGGEGHGAIGGPGRVCALRDGVTPVLYAAGGNGSARYSPKTGASKDANTGDGGDGSSGEQFSKGGNGGSGIVIVRYPQAGM